jgi:hypothetical protein
MLVMDPSVQRRAAQMAIEVLGSVYGVCAYLGVEPEDVYNWMTSTSPMPRECLLKILDVICDNLTASERHAVEAARSAGRAAGPANVEALLKSIARRP